MKINHIIWDNANKNLKLLFAGRLFDLIPTIYTKNYNKNNVVVIYKIPYVVVVADSPEDPEMTASALIQGHQSSITSICINNKKIIRQFFASTTTNYYFFKLKKIMNSLLRPS